MLIKIPLYKGANNNRPRKIVLHAMAEFIKYENQWMHAADFLRKIGLSAHALVTPSGDIIQCREDVQGAWHARGYNTDSLGIEFLVPGGHEYADFLEALKHPYISPQVFSAGVSWVKQKMDKWDIPVEEVVTHQEIDPVRKFDPGAGFPLEDFLTELR